MDAPWFDASARSSRTGPPGPSGRRRIRATLLAGALAVCAAPAVVAVSSPSVARAAAVAAGGVPAPGPAEVSPMCATSQPGAVLGPAPSLPATPVATVVTPPGGVAALTATATGLYVVNAGSPATLDEYTLTGALTGSFTLPAGFTGASEISQPVVDPSGDIYLSSYYGKRVDKFSPVGTVLWSVDPSAGNPTNLFMSGTGGGARLVVSLVQGRTSVVLDPSSGASGARFPYYAPVGSYVTTEASGSLLVAVNGYVQTVGADGAVTSSFGSATSAGAGTHTGGPYQFYYTGQAVQEPDGTIVTADPLGTVEATTATGYLLGRTTLGGALSFGGWGLQLVGTRFYVQSGAPFNGAADAVSSFSMSDLEAYLAAPSTPVDALGWGAGLATPVTGGYFAPGIAPSVLASFDPWWSAAASHLALTYSVASATTMRSETVPASTTVALPTTAAGLASIPLPVPGQDTLPGPYEVQATLVDDSTTPPTTLGTTCLPYTVGAAGDALSLSGLPAGIDGGGPGDLRGVSLNSQLGLDGLRAQRDTDWAALLPACNFGAPTPAACGASAMTFANASTDPYKAAYAAAADHVTYWYQVSGGESTDTALVGAGLWGQDVQALVAHYATVPSGCTACAPVTMWEPWNEPNDTGWPSGSAYTTSVLAPFDHAVKAVLPGAASTVIGGSSLEPSLPWWNQLVAAGGLSDMDVAAVHPYTGSDDSWEEDGMISQIRQLQATIDTLPLWFTEVGWWSDGDLDILRQADLVARAEIWMRVLGVPVWGYFFSEGSWGNDGVSFSLVQTGAGGDDYVKPAALASMASAAQLGGRAVVAQPPTGIPQTYRSDFGPTPGGQSGLTAVWSDGLDTTAAVTVTGPGTTAPVTVTDEYGGATSSTVAIGTAYALPVSDQVTYLTYPVGDTVTLGPPVPYGTNVALATAGATAAATSQTAGSGHGAGQAIAGLTAGYGQGWSSAPGDTAPVLTVTWPLATTVDRVVVDTASVGSTAPGLRNYTVALDEAGTWTTVATVTGQFRDHEQLLAVTPAVATGVRISVSEIDLGGYFGGGVPPWWTASPSGVTVVHALQVYAGTGAPAQVAGSGLPALTTGITVPATPTGLTATAGDGRATLAWSAVPAATGYTVYRDGTPVDTVTAPGDTVVGLPDGIATTFTVAATDVAGSSAQSTGVVIVPEPTAPPAPTGLTATAGPEQVALSWSAVPGATGYQILQNGVIVAVSTTPAVTITDLTDGTPYTFAVVATGAGGSSDPSAPIAATPVPPPPSAPTDLVATAGIGQVALTWTPVDGATGYLVDQDGSLVAETSGAAATVTGLAGGSTVTLSVVATGDGGMSDPSGPVSATVLFPTPLAPTGVTADAVSDTGATLSWASSPGASAYTVFADGTAVVTSASPTATVTGLAPGTPYDFVVTASNASGSSMPSAAATIVTMPCGLTVAPSGTAAVVSFIGATGQGAPTWTVLDAGVPDSGVTFTTSGSRVTARTRGLPAGSVHRWSVRGTMPGTTSPTSATVTFVEHAVVRVVATGTSQTLSWKGATAGMTWMVKGCSSPKPGCTQTTTIATGAPIQSGPSVTVTVGGLSPSLYYRYRVVGTDTASGVSSAASTLSDAKRG